MKMILTKDMSKLSHCAMPEQTPNNDLFFDFMSLAIVLCQLGYIHILVVLGIILEPE